MKVTGKGGGDFLEELQRLRDENKMLELRGKEMSDLLREENKVTTARLQDLERAREKLRQQNHDLRLALAKEEAEAAYPPLFPHTQTNTAAAVRLIAAKEEAYLPLLSLSLSQTTPQQHMPASRSRMGMKTLIRCAQHPSQVPSPEKKR